MVVITEQAKPDIRPVHRPVCENTLVERWEPSNQTCHCGSQMTMITKVGIDDNGEPYIPVLAYVNRTQSTKGKRKENAVFRSDGMEMICTNPRCSTSKKRKRLMVRHHDELVYRIWTWMHMWKARMVKAGRWDPKKVRK